MHWNKIIDILAQGASWYQQGFRIFFSNSCDFHAMRMILYQNFIEIYIKYKT